MLYSYSKGFNNRSIQLELIVCASPDYQLYVNVVLIRVLNNQCWIRSCQNRAVGVSWHLWPAGRDHINPVFLKLPKFLHFKCQLPEKKVCKYLNFYIIILLIILCYLYY